MKFYCQCMFGVEEIREVNYFSREDRTNGATGFVGFEIKQDFGMNSFEQLNIVAKFSGVVIIVQKICV